MGGNSLVTAVTEFSDPTIGQVIDRKAGRLCRWDDLLSAEDDAYLVDAGDPDRPQSLQDLTDALLGVTGERAGLQLRD
ncbi:MAG: hypothetical protein M0Z40_03795 [Actinomycetota bacterium]|nr:hypothetical protein [Actinomycetota bacterium]